MASEASARHDVVVVGAGAAGCVLAVELARRDPARRVLLLDAGSADVSAAVSNPVFFDALAEPGRTFADEDTLPADDELAEALHAVLAELLTPGRQPRPTAID